MAKEEDLFKHLMTWIINSGVSCHITLDETIFTNKRAIENSITIANGAKVHRQSIGNVEFDLDDQTIFIREILYVPGLDVNLLSISTLNRNRLNVLFKTNGVEIRRGDTLVTSKIFKGQMYLLCTFQMALLGAETNIICSNRIKYAIDANSKNNT